MLALVPAAAVLTKRFYLAGFVIFLIEGMILAFIATKFWGNDKIYAALLYMLPTLALWLMAFSNIRKFKGGK